MQTLGKHSTHMQPPHWMAIETAEYTRLSTRVCMSAYSFSRCIQRLIECTKAYKLKALLSRSHLLVVCVQQSLIRTLRFQHFQCCALCSALDGKSSMLNMRFVAHSVPQWNRCDCLCRLLFTLIIYAAFTFFRRVLLLPRVCASGRTADTQK